MLLDECMRALGPRPGETVCDCTLGGAGHSISLARAIAPDGLLIGIDRDDAALDAARSRLAEAETGLERDPVLLKGNFSDLDDLLLSARVPGVDVFLFDLGVSSPQFDIAERGFSYRADAPLDMRMDPATQTLTASEVLATYGERELARVLRDGGEEKWAQRIAHAVCERRSEAIESGGLTTLWFASVVKDAVPAAARRTGGHPAKRAFQALRIEVNGELTALERGLGAAIRWLDSGGRIAVISYHSLEDRRVKDAFREMEDRCTCPPDLPVCACGREPVLEVMTRRPIEATAGEVERNPRARSAKLRVARKL